MDCTNGNDEKNCLTTTPRPIKTSCEPPSRWCDNNTKCIDIEQLCDGEADCKDGSDEGKRCDENVCDHSIICSHICHNAPEGVACACPDHLHMQPDQTTCLESHPCESWGVCSQECAPIGKRYKCVCLEGYTLDTDGFTCKSVSSAVPYVIFSNRHELRGVDLNTFNVKSLISSLKNTIALDFYHSSEADMVSISV